MDCPAIGTVQHTDGRFAFSDIEITPVITLSVNSDETQTCQLADKANHYSLTSNSLNCPVTMQISLRASDVQVENLA